jgi:hypothetical protein
LWWSRVFAGVFSKKRCAACGVFVVECVVNVDSGVHVFGLWKIGQGFEVLMILRTESFLF